MLELIVLGKIPGTELRISFLEFAGVALLTCLVATYLFIKIKKIVSEYNEVQKEIDEKTI